MVILLWLEVEMRAVTKVHKVRKMRRKCKMGAKGYTPLFCNRTMTIGSRYGCILLCLPFGLTFWRLRRLRLRWVGR